MVVSKKIKKILRDFSPKEHWHIDPYRAFDTYYNLRETFGYADSLSVNSNDNR